MKKPLAKKIVRVVAYTFLIALMFLLFQVFFPRNYNAPQVQKREGTNYSNLSTGSRIGYTFDPSEGRKKTLSYYLFAWWGWWSYL